MLQDSSQHNSSFILCQFVQAKKIDEARPVYERLVSQFPTSGRYWKLYIEQEVSLFVDFAFRTLLRDSSL
jgi:hypothetical protein